jgi:hypothetical protein
MIFFVRISSKFLVLATICCLFAQTSLWAQPKQNSPYSRYGLGDLGTPGQIQQAGIGGVTQAYADPLHLNSVNPAALSSLDLTAFEGGFFVKGSTYKTRSQTNKAKSGNLSYLGLGFTLRNTVNESLEKTKAKNKIGMGFFLEPVSTVGYDVTSTDTVSVNQNIINQYQGSGGFYRFKYGAAIKRKNTSAGLFLGWQFGKAIYENTTLFDTFPSFQNNFRDEVYMKGLVYSLGVQHQINLGYLKNNKEVVSRWITLGLTANANKKVNLNSDELRIRSRGRTSNGAAYIDADTLKYLAGVNNTVTMPAQLGLGFMYNELNKWKVGADLNYANWSKYRNTLRSDSLANTISFQAGAEYCPNYLSYNNYLKRIRYRFGAYYRQDPREIGGKQLTDTGISLGAGLPLILPRQGTSALHLALELGKFGAGTAIEETYWRVSMGYTFNDNSWFFKRRFE